MDDLQEALNGILSDPKQMQELQSLAAELMGGGEAPGAPTLGALAQNLNAPPSNTQRLLEAMGPFLAPQRREKLRRAMRIAKLASVAQVALRESEGDHDESILWE